MILEGLELGISGSDLRTFGLAVGVILIGLFALYALLERDLERAAERSSERAFGLSVGIGSAITTAAVAGVETVAEVPGIIITAVGIGGILSGISWQVFAAVALIVYVVLAAVRGG